ncbi:MAG: hypothetical protein KAU62_18210 [Candidatus Heimdallarchaeota archaeon]|nr:hypothetical protein [Candidatus Heimdallarchaeota archaeon]MCG3258048.1 hypothetical protein [Candidatus Heimdallarchaeota archaeon]MCK4613097.1 hypothetical protein [Candidatus Heimdallarchaeota archaeon]
MVIIWGYTPSEALPNSKIIGEGVNEIKQLFSAILFKTGIKGICVNLEGISKKPVVKLSLVIDSESIYETSFSPERAREYSYELDETVFPKTKIEVVMSVSNGSVEVAISPIGIGMGFQKQDGEFVPTNHLALGVIIL